MGKMTLLGHGYKKIKQFDNQLLVLSIVHLDMIDGQEFIDNHYRFDTFFSLFQEFRFHYDKGV
jgi:hypothetical protein